MSDDQDLTIGTTLIPNLATGWQAQLTQADFFCRNAASWQQSHVQLRTTSIRSRFHSRFRKNASKPVALQLYPSIDSLFRRPLICRTSLERIMAESLTQTKFLFCSFSILTPKSTHARNLVSPTMCGLFEILSNLQSDEQLLIETIQFETILPFQYVNKRTHFWW